MMEKLSQVAGSKVVKFIFGLIILLLVLTSFSGIFDQNFANERDKQIYLAKVDGEGISRVAYESQVAYKLSKLFENERESLTPLVKEQVFYTAVNSHLIFKLAEKLKIQISDDLLINKIKKNKEFFRDGKFDYEYFLEYVSTEYKMTPEFYLESFKFNLKRKQLDDALLLTDFVLPVESKIFTLVNQQRIGKMKSLDIENYVDKTKIEIKDTEIENFYIENINKYKQDEAIKARYLVNSYFDVATKIQMPNEQESEIYYQLNSANYIEPEKNEFSLIELKNNEFDNISKLIKSSKNKAKISGQKIIKLGWFQKGKEPNYLTLLDLKKVGDHKITNLNGKDYIVILSNTIAERKQPFEQVKESIEEYIFQNKIKDKYEEISNSLKLARLNFSTIDEIATNTGLTIQTTENWQTKKSMSSLAIKPEIKLAIFNDTVINDIKEDKVLTDVIEIQDSKEEILLEVFDYRAEGIASFEDAKETAKEDLMLKKANELFDENLKLIINDLKNNNSNIKLDTNFEITRDSTNLDTKLVDEIFEQIPPLQPNVNYGYVLNNKEKATIFRLDHVKDGEITDLTVNLNEIRKEQNYTSFTEELRSKAKIEMMTEL